MGLDTSHDCWHAEKLIEAEITARLREILVTQLGVPANEILPETELGTLGVDSLDAVEISMEVEDQFGILIPDEETEEEMQPGAKFSDLVAYVKSKLN